MVPQAAGVLGWTIHSALQVPHVQLQREVMRARFSVC